MTSEQFDAIMLLLTSVYDTLVVLNTSNTELSGNMVILVDLLTRIANFLFILANIAMAAMVYMVGVAIYKIYNLFFKGV